MTEQQAMTTDEIIVKLRMMARYPTVTLPRDTEALKRAADLLQAHSNRIGWEPKRDWVGLTAEDVTQICIDCGCLGTDWLLLHSAIEAKLKEKNT